MSRLRVRFAKLGKVRWTSHRDVARMWERALRRLELPVAYSAGFSPRPRISFGLALPTGHESVAEYLDVELAREVDLDGLVERLSGALPVGVDAMALSALDHKVASLQEEVGSCTWRFVVAPALDRSAESLGVGPGEAEVAEKAALVLGASRLEVTRSRKGEEVTDDIRPGVVDLRVLGAAVGAAAPGVWVEAELATRPRSLRPAEVVAALGQVGGRRDGPGSGGATTALEERHVRRLHQWITHDGARREPIELPAGTLPPFAPADLCGPGGGEVGGDVPVATAAPHALGRAS